MLPYFTAFFTVLFFTALPSARRLPRLMRLADLRHVAIDLEHARGVADDPVDNAFRPPLRIARVDEDFENIVGR